jgi:hypothetical protein
MNIEELLAKFNKKPEFNRFVQAGLKLKNLGFVN